MQFESTCCSIFTQALRNSGDFSAACGGCGNVNSSGLLQHLLWMLPAEHMRLADYDRIGVLLKSPCFSLIARREGGMVMCVEKADAITR